VPIMAIDHVGIAVPDLETAIRQYTIAYGMTCTHRERNEEQGVLEATMAVGDSGAFVQLLAPTSPGSPVGRFLARHGPGLQQLAYRVDSIDEVSAHLQQQGMRLVYDAARRGSGGVRLNFVHPATTGGVLVELVAPARS